ncbi:MAG: hypothetical protein JRJ86_06275 [Deltaproteobacteria bacterium]|nr:hypothetical protein [Deltaproteobacteria bacterium]
MKQFPFKILFISIFLPPICYLLTLHMLEGYFQKREAAKLNQIIIQDFEALYEGRYTVKEEINRNIGEYLSRSLMFTLGVRMHILLKTKDEHILYPALFRKDLNSPHSEDNYSELPTRSLNFVEVASENYRILNQGLILSVDVRIKHNSWLSNSVLVFYVFLFVLILRRFIKKGIREVERQETEQKNLIQRLSDQLTLAEKRLKQAKGKEDNYLGRIENLKKEKKELSKDVDVFMEEMEGLESGLKEQRELKEEMEFEVIQLKEDMDRLKVKFKKPKQKKKAETTHKRFKVLYKNLIFTDRAVEGFLSLTDGFQLKAEEVIHKLNEDDTQVTVKRKVFGKGGKMNILEADFSYSGRIYYQKDSQHKTTVVTIGTKNTQEKDLAYIGSVA